VKADEQTDYARSIKVSRRSSFDNRPMFSQK
jgi:hypothetical protein